MTRTQIILASSLFAACSSSSTATKPQPQAAAEPTPATTKPAGPVTRDEIVSFLDGWLNQVATGDAQATTAIGVPAAIAFSGDAVEGACQDATCAASALAKFAPLLRVHLANAELLSKENVALFVTPTPSMPDLARVMVSLSPEGDGYDGSLIVGVDRGASGLAVRQIDADFMSAEAFENGPHPDRDLGADADELTPLSDDECKALVVRLAKCGMDADAKAFRLWLVGAIYNGFDDPSFYTLLDEELPRWKKQPAKTCKTWRDYVGPQMFTFPDTIRGAMGEHCPVLMDAVVAAGDLPQPVDD